MANRYRQSCRLVVDKRICGVQVCDPVRIFRRGREVIFEPRSKGHLLISHPPRFPLFQRGPGEAQPTAVHRQDFEILALLTHRIRREKSHEIGIPLPLASGRMGGARRDPHPWHALQRFETELTIIIPACFEFRIGQRRRRSPVRHFIRAHLPGQRNPPEHQRHQRPPHHAHDQAISLRSFFRLRDCGEEMGRRDAIPRASTAPRVNTPVKWLYDICFVPLFHGRHYGSPDTQAKQNPRHRFIGDIFISSASVEISRKIHH